MKHLYALTTFPIICLLLTAACTEPPRAAAAAQVTRAAAILDEQLRHADARPGDWLSHGRSYAEDRHSPLDRISTENVHELGLVWSYDLGTERGIEATPIVADGILFATGPWSVVYAFDVRRGELIWVYDPEVPRRYGDVACCDVVNRGVALYAGKVYAGTFDGRLVAIDAASGSPVWEVVTVDQAKPYSITGAPRVVDAKVIIGNGGAEFGVRGYISAYDATTGDLAWRTYTVPGDPSQPFESEALEKAAATWTGEWWEMGGGGTAWDSMSYDPALHLLYVGTGNGAPWDRRYRSPGGGDNLYLSSILALDPDTGDIVWHYQTTPGDHWDFTATQHMILADLEIGGRTRKVLMQAPKNGFFYVLDRVTGELISAEPYVPLNWADRVDPATGRPVERPGSDYLDAAFDAMPGVLGAHNWQPMAFNPDTGLVYIPAQIMPWRYERDAGFRYTAGGWNAGVKIKVDEQSTGHLLAWDPVAQKEAWRVEHVAPWNGGVLSTAGNLVFQGTADGRLVAYDARDGAKLWEAPTGTGVIAPPVTYLVDGRQYVTVLAGWGGAWGQRYKAEGTGNVIDEPGRVFTFALGGDAPSPVGTAAPEPEAEPAPYAPEPGWSAEPEVLARGEALFHQHCARCHGAQAKSAVAAIPDLRYASTDVYDGFERIVLEGLRASGGMPGFGSTLSGEDARAIRDYLFSRSIAVAGREKQPATGR